MKHYLLAMAVLALVPAVLRADTTSANILTNPGAETGSLKGWTVGGNSKPTVDDGTLIPAIHPHAGKYDFAGGSGDYGTLTQNQSLEVPGVTLLDIQQGLVTANLSFWEQGLNQGDPSDNGAVLLFFFDENGQLIKTSSSGEVDFHNGNWKQFKDSYGVPKDAVSVQYQMYFTRHVGTDLDAYMDDNSLTLTVFDPTVPIPEPSCQILLGTGMLGVVRALRRRCRA